MIASPIIGIWYWCTDQYIVQRTLAARSLTDARAAPIWGGFLKLFPVFIFLVPGMIGYALHEKGLLSDPDGRERRDHGRHGVPDDGGELCSRSAFAGSWSAASSRR